MIDYLEQTQQGHSTSRKRNGRPNNRDRDHNWEIFEALEEGDFGKNTEEIESFFQGLAER